MKKYISLFLFIALFTGFSVNAQDAEKRPSPAQTSEAVVDGGKVSVAYSSPGVKGRVVYGELVPYGKVWRTGANEATILTVEKDVTINGETLKAGKYGLFTIPGEKEWTVIINKVWDQWGAYNYDKDEDVMRFTVAPEKLGESVERMTFDVKESGTVSYAWEKVGFSFDID